MENSFEKQKLSLLKAAERRCMHAERRLENCRQQLVECLSWESTQHQGSLLQANLYRIKRGMKEVTVSDWLAEGKEIVLPLNPLLSAHEQVQQLFKKSRKHKAAIPHLETQISKREAECIYLREQFTVIEALEDEAALLAWREGQQKAAPARKERPKVALPYHEFYSHSGLSIRVGKGAKSNDLLTFRHSKGSDWWFHVRDYPGSHVVLCVAKGHDPDDASVHDAMLLALAYSKARDEREAEITVTQCKHVHRFPGGPAGKVQISKHKTMLIRQDSERLKLIKSRPQTRK